ncbi:MAG: TIGR02466 family protein, partial [Micropepsaceae bacterium]
AGQAWCREHAYAGYTSYASLNDLTVRAPAFADLERRLAPHIATFAKALHFDLAKKLTLDSIWINVLKPGGAHSGHIHPASTISGTYYVTVPKGASALKLEDPRLGLMMAAPRKRETAPRNAQPFAYITPKPGTLILFESWLRHEVPANTARENRISVSFNYA